MSGWRIAAAVIIGLSGMWVLAALLAPAAATRQVPYSPTFLTELRTGNVERIRMQGTAIRGSFSEPVQVPGGDGRRITRFETAVPVFADRARLRKLLDESGVPVVAEAEPSGDGGGINLFWLLLLSLAPAVLLIGFLVWIARRAGGMGGGGGPFAGLARSRARRVHPSRERVSFDDVAGIDEAREELREIVAFLREPKRYLALGARVPRGVLLAGAPGTGKTMLARALAGEADVPFFSVAATEFVEMVVGVGAARVRDMFEQAKKAAPAVVFIDELDAVGARRSSAGASGSNEEREQTLNQILAEMDGFETSETVVVVGATNRPDDLDEALLRPGRFDRHITIQAPDLAGRRKILEVHTRSLPLAEDVDLDALAKQTPGFVGADLGNLVNEAALAAGRRRETRVAMHDFQASFDKLALGMPRAVMLSEEDRRLTAYHEAGHALVAMLTPEADPVRKVTVVPRGRALGATMAAPESDRTSARRSYLDAHMRVLLGGRASEETAFGEVSTGAEDDLEQATRLARRMVGRWGMSAHGAPLSWLPRDDHAPLAGLNGGAPSEFTRRRLDREVEVLVRRLYEDVLRNLRANRRRLDALANALLEHETLDQAAAYAAAGIERHGAPTR